MNPTRLLLSFLLLGALGTQATPLEPAQIPKEANWFVHADLDKLRESSAGQLVVGAIEEKHGNQLKAVKRIFSINPFTDLHAITLWGNGEKDQAAALVRATFDREHLTDLIGAADDHQTSNHHDDVVHTWTDKKKTNFGAFVGRDLIVFSEQKNLVLLSLDVLARRSDATEKASPAGPASFLLGFANLDGIEIKGDEAKLLQQVKSLQVRFFERDTRLHAAIDLEAADPDKASRFAKVLDGIVALGQLTNEDIANLNLNTEVSVKDGNTVQATLSIPSDLILNAIKEAGDLGNL